MMRSTSISFQFGFKLFLAQYRNPELICFIQLAPGLFTRDNVSQLTHLIGGAVGTAAGFLLNRKK